MDTIAIVTLRVKRARRVCGGRALRGLAVEKVAARRLARRVANGDVRRFGVEDWDDAIVGEVPRLTEREVF